ncbi:RNA-directed DNA polymerase from mobile element jockey [Trichonephila clavipes]|nr:RNA-directed DNA polymerase from mobile element jockey [Trichonephila clavipes]
MATANDMDLTQNGIINYVHIPSPPFRFVITDEFIYDNQESERELINLRDSYAVCGHGNFLFKRTLKNLRLKTDRKRLIDDDGFQTPDKRHTAKKIGKKNPSLPPTTFQTPNPAQAPPPPAESRDSEIEDEDGGKSNPTAVGAPKKRIPPTFVNPPDNWCTSISIARQIAPTLISKLTGKFLRITNQSDDEYRKLTQFLRHEGVEYKSFMLISDRPLILLICGLPTSNKIANDGGVDEELLAWALRAALQKLSHLNDMTSNGQRSKIHEVRDFVLEQNLDLFLVQETKLEPGQDYLIVNYQLYKDDRVIFLKIRTAGGTAIYCKNIRSKIRHRNRVRRFWQRSRDPALKNELRTISNEIASDIRHFSRARWEKTIEELSPEPGTLWRRTSFLKKPFHHIPPLKGALGSIAVAPIEKAEVIADSLQKQFEPNTDVENPRFSAHIQRKVQRFLDSPTCMDLEKTSPSEIQGFIKNLKPNKSPGIDLITNRILKNLPTKFIIFIALLFNMLLENCYFPKSWRMAVVIPILKPNSDDSNDQNYRPISLLSSLSKAYEFVILNRLNQHCLARNIIIPEQHGFVTKCSTVTQLLRVTELVHTGFQNH